MTQNGVQLGDFNPTETEGNHDGSQLSKMEGKKILESLAALCAPHKTHGFTATCDW